jgi:hypothetical protein
VKRKIFVRSIVSVLILLLILILWPYSTEQRNSCDPYQLEHFDRYCYDYHFGYKGGGGLFVAKAAINRDHYTGPGRGYAYRIGSGSPKRGLEIYKIFACICATFPVNEAPDPGTLYAYYNVYEAILVSAGVIGGYLWLSNRSDKK